MGPGYEKVKIINDEWEQGKELIIYPGSRQDKKNLNNGFYFGLANFIINLSS